MKKNIRILLPITVLVLATLACQAMSSLPVGQTPPAVGDAPQVVEATSIPVVISAPSMQEQEQALTSLYDHVTPGVVAIQVLTDNGSALGTGIVFDNQGNLVTNYHVVEGQKKIEVDFPTGYKTFGTLVGTDLDSDLAVIKVDAPAEELHPLALG